MCPRPRKRSQHQARQSMQQVLFTFPFLKTWFPPDGMPVYGFGAMLFVTFILVTLWGTRRASRIGMPAERFQDFTIWVFVSGIIGARVLYMIQYANQFPDQSLMGLAGAFFKIWEGGIIFYGSALGGALGYGLFYWFVMRRLNVSGWQLADAVAPLLALGMAIGRIGCYLNGCCWGQVAIEECRTIPIGAAHFPLLPAHARGQLVNERHLQTSTGFAINARNRSNRFEDPRAEVTAVERGSPADKAGVLVGDRVVKVNGNPNAVVVEVSGSEEKVRDALQRLQAAGATLSATPQGREVARFDAFPAYLQGRERVESEVPGVDLRTYDTLEEMSQDWPRGKSQLTIGVERGGNVVELPPFAPQTIGLYPTQLYETISMLLLIPLLLVYYPYRRHDGQLMVILMLGYSIHRFINESLRVEPAVAGGLTLSQWGSVVIFAAAIGIETYLWMVMPSRWSQPREQVAPAPQGPTHGTA